MPGAKSGAKNAAEGAAGDSGFERLLRAATEARERSYSPYSGRKVGAAIRTADGKVFAGCNVENSSYGATVCAERVAVQSAVAASGRPKVVEVVIVTDAAPPWPPCGLCRQVLAEFADPSALVHACNLAGDRRSHSLAGLFPEAFTPERLS